LSDQQLAEVAFQGLLPYIMEKYASQEFDSISQMAHRMAVEIKSYEQKRSNFQKKVNFATTRNMLIYDDFLMTRLSFVIEHVLIRDEIFIFIMM